MSEPNPNHPIPFVGVSSEVSSAMSALNMEPLPLAKPLGDHGYLSETDHWAAHSRDHLFAALSNLSHLSEKIRKANLLVFALLREQEITENAATQLLEAIDIHSVRENDGE